MKSDLSPSATGGRVREFELIRMTDGGEVRVWADGQIDILRESHMTVGFRAAKRRQSTPSETRCPKCGEKING